MTIQIDLGPSVGKSQTLSFRSDNPVWLDYMKSQDRVSLSSLGIQGQWIVVSVTRHVDDSDYKVQMSRYT